MLLQDSSRSFDLRWRVLLSWLPRNNVEIAFGSLLFLKLFFQLTLPRQYTELHGERRSILIFPKNLSSVSVCLCVCASVCLRVCVSVCLCVCVSVGPCKSVSVYLCFDASVCACRRVSVAVCVYERDKDKKRERETAKNEWNEEHDKA